MANTIANAANRPLNIRTGSIPDVGGAMRDWMQPMIFELVTKSNSGFQVVETADPIEFDGVIQPFTARQLAIKPEGERAWTWFLLHADPVLTLQVDDIVVYLGKATRVMARSNFALYGFVEYHLVQDWTGAGPIIPADSSIIDGGSAFTKSFAGNVDGGFASTIDYDDGIEGGSAFVN